MKKQKLPIRQFCFVSSETGKKVSKQMTLQNMIFQTDFTNQDVENICILPIGETVFLTADDEFGVRRLR